MIDGQFSPFSNEHTASGTFEGRFMQNKDRNIQKQVCYI